MDIEFKGLTFNCRLAQALAGSFNFQGRIKKTFYVLADGKTTTGPRSASMFFA